MSYFCRQMSGMISEKKSTTTSHSRGIANLNKFLKNEGDKGKYAKLNFDSFLSDKMLLIHFIQKGVSYAFFQLIQDYAPFETEVWARLLNISSKTLLRHKQSGKKFKPFQSEKIIEMAEVTHAGLEVFGAMEKFRLWLDTPNFALGI